MASGPIVENVVVICRQDRFEALRAALHDDFVHIEHGTSLDAPPPPSCWLIVDVDSVPEARLRGLAPLLAPALTASRTLFCSSAPGAELAPLLAAGALRHLLPPLESSSGLAGLRLVRQQLASETPLELLPAPQDGFGIVHRRLRCSSEKAEVLAEAERLVGTAVGSSRLAIHFVGLVEELLTNALFNAPVDEEGVHRFAHLPRDARVELADDERIDVRLCAASGQIGVRVEDPFGSLSPRDVSRYLAKGLASATNRVDAKEGGAGLGLHLVFHGSSRFVLHLAPGRRTLATAVLNAERGLRALREGGKTFSLFVRGDAGALS